MSINRTPDIQPIYATSIVKFDADGHPGIPYDAGVTLKLYSLKPSDQGITRVQPSYALASTSNLININFEMTEDPNARAEGASLSFCPPSR